MTEWIGRAVEELSTESRLIERAFDISGLSIGVSGKNDSSIITSRNLPPNTFCNLFKPSAEQIAEARNAASPPPFVAPAAMQVDESKADSNSDSSDSSEEDEETSSSEEEIDVPSDAEVLTLNQPRFINSQESDDGEVEMVSLIDATPKGYTVQSSCPPKLNKSLVGRKILMCFEVFGWTLGKVPCSRNCNVTVFTDNSSQSGAKNEVQLRRGLFWRQ
jgi:hypothetical protein